MNKYILSSLTVLALGFAQAAENCKPHADATAEAVSKDPDKVLEIVSKDVGAQPKCACPIMLAAIGALNDPSPQIKREIAAAALAAAPSEAQAIIACFPEAASAMGSGKEPVASGKEPVASGKEPVGPTKTGEDAPIDEELPGPFSGISGATYLSNINIPGGSRPGTPGDDDQPDLEPDPEEPEPRRPPSRPTTPANPVPIE